MDRLIRLDQQQMAYLEEQFGSQMPRHILSNGWDYYCNRRVMTTEVIEGNSIYGAVNGSSVYAVVLHTDEFGYSKCTCEYAGYCKHMAAVFYQYCALIGLDSEEMYRHLVSEGTIEQKRMKRELAAKRPPDEAGPDVWREWFFKMYGEMWKHCKQSLHPLQAVLSEMKSTAKHWERIRQRLHWMHAIEFVLEQVELAYEATDSYSRYYYELSFNRTVDPWIHNFYELTQGMYPSALGEEEERWLESLTSTLRQRAMSVTSSLLRWDLLYHALTEKLAVDMAWRQGERKLLQAVLAEVEHNEGEITGQQSASQDIPQAKRLRPAAFVQAALACLDMVDGDDAEAARRMQETEFERTSELVYKFVNRRLEERLWEGFRLWMDYLHEKLAGSRNSGVLRPYLTLCRQADVIGGGGQAEWNDRLIAFLPASYHELAAHWLHTAQYEEWADLQLYLGIRPDELDAGDLRLVSKSAPASLIPLYHQAVDEAILARNRQGYRTAVRLMKKLEKLYTEEGQTGKWNRYVSRIADKYQRLRAFQEELWKGKVMS
ncbi:SWIM zinc finger domain-containing protein [Paenibacillus sp. GCM10012307]|uniref:SWIM-type domain-containing protein n=1 Tax=Paenibacillus roseus TaxID=2798579 RepID=A0A934J6I4_9BACL|nr:hypothetical protein [Paenibacillus roseus]MBJ6363795.1 hypothetical protein [Paenibacillus roseus]